MKSMNNPIHLQVNTKVVGTLSFIGLAVIPLAAVPILQKYDSHADLPAEGGFTPNIGTNVTVSGIPSTMTAVGV